jgi:hypothetical protein
LPDVRQPDQRAAAPATDGMIPSAKMAMKSRPLGRLTTNVNNQSITSPSKRSNPPSAVLDTLTS